MPANVVVPEVGESIVDARVAKWLKKEGDAVNVGEPLVELETDKIDLEVAAPQAGVLEENCARRRRRREGRRGPGVIEEGAAPAPATAPAQDEAAKRPSLAEAAPAAKAETAPAAKAETGSGTPESKQRSTPAARNVAQQNAVDLKQVSGSGDAGRVMKRDVEQVVAEKPAAKPAAAGAEPTAAGEERRPATASASKNACACRNAAPRSPRVWSKRRARPPC